jgi:hypothetical protein
MKANATIGEYALVDSARVHVGPPRIEVTCGPSTIMRAAQVSCVAHPLPESASLSVTGWRFVGASATVVRTQTPIEVSWGGLLVMDGTVQVTGIVDGQPLTGEAPVSVTPRDWTGKPVQLDHQNLGQGEKPSSA